MMDWYAGEAHASSSPAVGDGRNCIRGSESHLLPEDVSAHTLALEEPLHQFCNYCLQETFAPLKAGPRIACLKPVGILYKLFER